MASDIPPKGIPELNAAPSSGARNGVVSWQLAEDANMFEAAYYKLDARGQPQVVEPSPGRARRFLERMLMPWRHSGTSGHRAKHAAVVAALPQRVQDLTTPSTSVAVEWIVLSRGPCSASVNGVTRPESRPSSRAGALAEATAAGGVAGSGCSTERDPVQGGKGPSLPGHVRLP
jgi:hypothetical protein